MARKPYTLTSDDKELLNALVLDLATELDLHYEEEDLHALSRSYSLVKDAVALLRRADCQVHPDILTVLARYNKTQQ